MSVPRDDAAAFLADLRSGRPFRVLVSPAFLRLVPEPRRFLGYLASLGAVGFHAVLPYADVACWAYWRLLGGREAPGRSPPRIAVSACAGVTSRRRAAGAPSVLPPVPSPLQCAATVLRGRDGCVEDFAFLSPCAFKWTEFRGASLSADPGGRPLVVHNATIAGILKEASDGLDWKEFPEARVEGEGEGATVAAFGSLLAPLRLLLPGLDGEVAEGADAFRALDELGLGSACPRGPYLLEPYACRGGCERGSGTGGARCAFPPPARGPLPTREDLLKAFARFDATLDPAAFVPGHPGRSGATA